MSQDLDISLPSPEICPCWYQIVKTPSSQSGLPLPCQQNMRGFGEREREREENGTVDQ